MIPFNTQLVFVKHVFVICISLSLGMICASSLGFAAPANTPDAQAKSSKVVDLRNSGYVKKGSVEDLIKIRCGTDGEDAWTVWTGEIYSYVPQERQRHLFSVVGANVARCKQLKDGTWYFTSREVQYYLDPKTGARLDKWKNPWTERTVPVMHVANELVQGKLKWAPDLTIDPPFATLRMPINLLYPNRLSKDDTLKKYSPEAMYQAGEFFGLLSPISDLKDPKKTRASMSLTWTRVGPWLPWMDMGDQAGYLVYSADGSKLESFEELPKWLQDEMKTRIPLYQHAPKCFLKARNVSSWSYFARHKANYDKGEQFPVPAPIKDEPCVEDPTP